MKDLLIFEKSLKTQMKRLIVDPIEHPSRAIPKPELAAFPHAILIDGLDECADEQRQAELLATINHCLLQNEALPFLSAFSLPVDRNGQSVALWNPPGIFTKKRTTSN
jgi:hypothetical protein